MRKTDLERKAQRFKLCWVIAISSLIAASLTFAFSSHYMAHFSAACGQMAMPSQRTHFPDRSLPWLGGQGELGVECMSQAPVPDQACLVLCVGFTRSPPQVCLPWQDWQV